ncbi:unnamed protein product, partial [marine sediment metagenome]
KDVVGSRESSYARDYASCGKLYENWDYEEETYT